MIALRPARAFGIVALAFLPTLARAQTGAAPPLSDAAILSREQSAWDALARRDSLGAIAILGDNVSFTIFGANATSQTTTAALVRNITSRCTTTRNQLDSVHVSHPTPTTDILTYTVALERTCGPNPATLVNLRVESVWGESGGRRVAMSQILIPKK